VRSLRQKQKFRNVLNCYIASTVHFLFANLRLCFVSKNLKLFAWLNWFWVFTLKWGGNTRILKPNRRILHFRYQNIWSLKFYSAINNWLLILAFHLPNFICYNNNQVPENWLPSSYPEKIHLKLSWHLLAWTPWLTVCVWDKIWLKGLIFLNWFIVFFLLFLTIKCVIFTIMVSFIEISSILVVSLI
jgi:hypothetical protein